MAKEQFGEGFDSDLAFIFDDADSPFISLQHSLAELQLAVAEEQLPDWRAVASVAVHLIQAFEQHVPKADLELWLPGSSADWLLGLLTQLKDEVGSRLDTFLSPGSTMDEYRLQFHTPVALGFLLLLKGDAESAKAVFGEMAASRPSWDNRDQDDLEILHGDDFDASPVDFSIVSERAAAVLESVLGTRDDFDEVVLWFYTECQGIWLDTDADLAIRRLEAWADRCEQAGPVGDFDALVRSGWMQMLSVSSRLLSVFGSDRSEHDTSPDQCPHRSAAYLAWHIGGWLARLACTFPSDGGGSLDQPPKLLSEIAGQVEVLYESRKVAAPDEPATVSTQLLLGWTWCDDRWSDVANLLRTLQHLVCYLDVAGDWRLLRERFQCIWLHVPVEAPGETPKAGPGADSFWAVALGFVDHLLGRADHPAGAIRRPDGGLPTSQREMLAVMDEKLTAISLRLLKEERLAEERHIEVRDSQPPSKKLVRRFIVQHVQRTGDPLPGAVANCLVKAELYYRTEVDDADARVWFCKAVEASLKLCFVEPLLAFLAKRGYRQISIPTGSGGLVEEKSRGALARFSLRDWAEVLEYLTQPVGRDLHSLGTAWLREFSIEHMGEPRVPDLGPLARSLREIQDWRGGSAHYQAIDRDHESDRAALEDMRKLILGIGTPSVIGEVFRLLVPRGS